MAKIEIALKALAKGEFICPILYPEEFDLLETTQGKKQASEWLEAINYRLARLSDEGAFFMAHSYPSTEMRNKVRGDIKNIRSRLEPYVGILEILREMQGRDAKLHPGDTIWLTQLSEAVRESASLDRRLGEMRELADGRTADGGAIVQRLQKMLNQLVAGSYLVETNPVGKGYTFTGKVEYLHQMIAFIAENTSDLSDEQVVDQIDAQTAQAQLNTGMPTPKSNNGENGEMS